MNLLATSVFYVALGISSIPKDVQIVCSRKLAMPLNIDPNKRDNIAKLRLLVSSDRGKSWKCKSDHQPSDPFVRFEADAEKTQYWLALQVVFKDGRCEPATLEKMTAGIKMFVDSKSLFKGRPAEAEKSYEQMIREVEKLQQTAEQLKKRVK